MTVDDRRTLPNTGYIESIVKLPFSEAAVSTLLLSVSTTEYNKTVPIIVGTNIISHLKQSVSEDDSISDALELAFSSICNNPVGVARLKESRGEVGAPLNWLKPSSKNVLLTAPRPCFCG